MRNHWGRSVIAVIVSRFVSAALAFSEPLANWIAEDPTVKGKGKDGACMDYALALSSRLAANGIHGQLIFYRWHIRNTAIQASHVFVAYRLSDESAWIVDNEIPHPYQPDQHVPSAGDGPQLYLTQLLRNLPAARINELTAWLPGRWRLGQAA